MASLSDLCGGKQQLAQVSGEGNPDCCMALARQAKELFIADATTGSVSGGEAREEWAVCGMTAWWGGARVVGEQLSGGQVASAEMCCARCVDAGLECIGWTYNTADTHCQVRCCARSHYVVPFNAEQR